MRASERERTEPSSKVTSGPITGRFVIIDSLAALTLAGKLDPATMMRLSLRCVEDEEEEEEEVGEEGEGRDGRGGEADGEGLVLKNCAYACALALKSD